MEPIIRWAGSKRQLLHKLRPFWPTSSRYIEPFCGSACLFFDLEPPAAVLGDLNGELITTYRAVRRNASLVVECLQRLALGKQEYYRIRSIPPESLSEPEIAARFLYLNRNCFNGIFRTNLKGSFNVPYAPPKSKTGVDYERLLVAAEVLQKAILLNADFETTLLRVTTGDFVYLDPPYAMAKRRVFAQYQPDSFSTSDLERLVACLRRIDEQGAHFVVSYADCSESRAILRAWQPRRVKVKRHVAGFIGKRRSAYEVIATNIEGLVNE